MLDRVLEVGPSCWAAVNKAKVLLELNKVSAQQARRYLSTTHDLVSRKVLWPRSVLNEEALDHLRDSVRVGLQGGTTSKEAGAHLVLKVDGRGQPARVDRRAAIINRGDSRVIFELGMQVGKAVGSAEHPMMGRRQD